MSSPAVPLTQARSHTRRLPREPALEHQRLPRVGYSDAAILAVDRLPQEPDVVAARERSDAERARREIGFPPTPRMWTWWAVLAVYLMAATALVIAGAYVVQWTHLSLTRAELDQVAVPPTRF